MEDQFVKPMALSLCELGEAHDVGCLGTEAMVQHCCCLSLTEMDADRRLTHASYFCNPVFKLVDLTIV